MFKQAKKFSYTIYREMFINTNVLENKMQLLVYSWEAVIMIYLRTCQSPYVYFAYF